MHGAPCSTTLHRTFLALQHWHALDALRFTLFAGRTPLLRPASVALRFAVVCPSAVAGGEPAEDGLVCSLVESILRSIPVLWYCLLECPSYERFSAIGSISDQSREDEMRRSRDRDIRRAERDKRGVCWQIALLLVTVRTYSSRPGLCKCKSIFLRRTDLEWI